MGIDRRTMLKSAAVAGATALAGASPAMARERKVAPTNAVGLLYDTTRCVGCKACVTACREANEETRKGCSRTLIRQYSNGSEQSFVKTGCMHCIDPACAGACMLGALQKREFGIVTWNPDLCVGCRYCQVACPYNAPKFEWESATPRIVKCEMCKHLLAEGKHPACSDACPRGAIEFGERIDLLETAHRRIREHPERYYPRVYGEHELGGTQVLVLSHVPFEKIGLANGSDEPVPALQQTIQHGIYKGFSAPIALYALLGGVMLRHRRVNRINEQGAGPDDHEVAPGEEADE